VPPSTPMPGAPPRLDVPFAVARELFAQDEVFYREYRGRA
jgi:hypothetical protein